MLSWELAQSIYHQLTMNFTEQEKNMAGITQTRKDSLRKFTIKKTPEDWIREFIVIFTEELRYYRRQLKILKDLRKGSQLKRKRILR